MPNTEAVSLSLMETLGALQQLPSLANFGLAGGTGLAIRFGHRKSIDIDLFSNDLVGIAGMKAILDDISNLFGKEHILYSELINDEAGEQYCFGRVLIRRGNEQIKVELLQNVPLLDALEINDDGIRMVSVLDIGLLKLTSLCSRLAKKDAYDLDQITDEDGCSLPELMALYQEKLSKYKDEASEWVFDLDEPPNPVEQPQLLLAFDETTYTAKQDMPSHSDDQLDIVDGGKSYHAAKSSWRRKVRAYLRDNGFDLPGIQPVN